MKFASRNTIFQHKYSNMNSFCLSFLLPSNDNFGQLKFSALPSYGLVF